MASIWWFFVQYLGYREIAELQIEKVQVPMYLKRPLIAASIGEREASNALRAE